MQMKTEPWRKKQLFLGWSLRESENLISWSRFWLDWPSPSIVQTSFIAPMSLYEASFVTWSAIPGHLHNRTT